MAPPPAVPLEEAERRLAARVPPPAFETAALDGALGAVAAEDVTLDVDLPPFHRAMMDGFAVRSADGAVELEILEDVPAGRMPTRPIGPGACARIMTGAPVPEGADAVQQVEKTEPRGPRVRVLEAVRPGQNVAPRGSDAPKGTRVVAAGRRMGPAQIAALAAAGRTQVRIGRRPRCAMLATGDELVPPSELPGPGRIRNTNGFGVPAQVRAMGLECAVLDPARDSMEDLAPRIREGLKADVLLLTGGVSAGEWDLVVPALAAEGVTAQLHQVLIKPGRPFFFGTRDRTVVFGLPGNPVSAFVTFEVFVRPFLGRMMGEAAPGRRRVTARLAVALPKPGDRVQFHPALLEGGSVRPLPWRSSADLVTLAQADALAIQPLGRALAEGDSVDVIVLE